MQKINLVLLKKGKEFESGDEFRAWAIGVAKYEVLAFARTRQRDRLTFSPELVDLMTNSATSSVVRLTERHLALKKCLSLISPDKQKLLLLKYAQDVTVSQLACEFDKSEGAIKAILLRMRRSLQKCIDSQMSPVSSS
jgi:RNA polymerase sigma-70 factor (ECF subfamily)